jgi:predicted alpha/beta-hydrolase family hydrolase
MDSPFMDAIAERVAGAGIGVIPFEFEYVDRQRQEGRRRGLDRAPKLIARFTDVLSLVGTKEEVDAYSLSPSIEVVWIEDGDHSLKPRKASGRTLDQNLAAAAHAVVELIKRLA